MDIYLDQLSRVIKAQDLSFLRYVVSDGAYNKQKFVAVVLDLGMHQIGKLRADAKLHHLYQGRGRPKTYDGKVHVTDLSRFKRLETDDDRIVLYHHVFNHIQLKRNLQVVVVVHVQHNRHLVLLSTDLNLEPLQLYRYYQARF